MVSWPPSGMASRALIARLRIAFSSWLASTTRARHAVARDDRERDVLADRAAQQFLERAEQRVDVDRPEHPATGGARRRAGARSAPAARCAEVLAASMKRSRSSMRPAAMRRFMMSSAADDAGQHVVEVVRDAAGQLADRLHLLALAQRRLGLGAARPSPPPAPRCARRPCSAQQLLGQLALGDVDREDVEAVDRRQRRRGAAGSGPRHRGGVRRGAARAAPSAPARRASARAMPSARIAYASAVDQVATCARRPPRRPACRTSSHRRGWRSDSVGRGR